MATYQRAVAAIALVLAAAAAAAAQPGPAPGNRAWVESLKPEWSRPVGGRVRFVGVEEYGRCSVFVDNGVIQVVAPSGGISWTWPFAWISKYINPRDVAVSHACDAIAFVGDASYKYVWVVDRAGASASLKFTATPADVEFDRTGKLVAVGTYSGDLFLFSTEGQLVWTRKMKARIVDGLWFEINNIHVAFDNWTGHGAVTMAGQTKWDEASPEEPDDSVLPPGGPYSARIAMSEDGALGWFRGPETIDCADRDGHVLATIDLTPENREVRVSRDFSQVLIVREKDLTPVSVERYEVPETCKLKMQR